MARHKADTPLPAETSTAPDKAPGAERDPVFFYSRLSQSLERAGSEALAARLASLRRSAAPDANASAATPAIGRFLRRLGIMRADDEAAGFVAAFSSRVSGAVSRTTSHVSTLLELFAVGDEGLGLKPICGATPDCSLCKLTRECDHFNNPRKPVFALLTPVERLLSGNDQALSDAELVAVYLFGEKGTGREQVVETLFARYGRLRPMSRAEPGEFAAIRDMGKTQVVRLAALAALHRRLLAERRDTTLHIGSARDIHDRYAAELREYRVEAAVLLMLDQHHNVIRDAWFCETSPNSAAMTAADLLRPAVREFAVKVALVHNHPSADPTPSEADLAFTRRLEEACDILGLGLVDHVIVTEGNYFSFAEAGLLGRQDAKPR